MRRPLSYDEAQLSDLCTELGLRLVVAFGSRVGGNIMPTDESDLDIAVLDSAIYSGRRHVAVYNTLSTALRPFSIDLAFLAQADPLFRYEIFRTAERLYGDDLEFLNQRAYAYSGFVDSADLRGLEDALFRKKMTYLKRTLDGSP